MANLHKLRGKDLEKFITSTLKGLKAIRRETREAIKDLNEVKNSVKDSDLHE